MKIVTVPNKVLKKPSIPVEKVDKKLINFIAELESTLINKKNPEGVGLSAPQVGFGIRIFSTLLKTDGQKQIKTYINPLIKNPSQKMTLGPDPKEPFLEGCLSIPNVFGAVNRHHSLTLEYQTINPKTMEFQTQSKRFESFPARVVQHEFDHLEGILFTKRTLEQGFPLYTEQNGKLVEIDLPS